MKENERNAKGFLFKHPLENNNTNINVSEFNKNFMIFSTLGTHNRFIHSGNKFNILITDDDLQSYIIVSKEKKNKRITSTSTMIGMANHQLVGWLKTNSFFYEKRDPIELINSNEDFPTQVMKTYDTTATHLEVINKSPDISEINVYDPFSYSCIVTTPTRTSLSLNLTVFQANYALFSMIYQNIKNLENSRVKDNCLFFLKATIISLFSILLKINTIIDKGLVNYFQAELRHAFWWANVNKMINYNNNEKIPFGEIRNLLLELGDFLSISNLNNNNCLSNIALNEGSLADYSPLISRILQQVNNNLTIENIENSFEKSLLNLLFKRIDLTKSSYEELKNIISELKGKTTKDKTVFILLNLTEQVGPYDLIRIMNLLKGSKFNIRIKILYTPLTLINRLLIEEFFKFYKQRIKVSLKELYNVIYSDRDTIDYIIVGTQSYELVSIPRFLIKKYLLNEKKEDNILIWLSQGSNYQTTINYLIYKEMKSMGYNIHYIPW